MMGGNFIFVLVVVASFFHFSSAVQIGKVAPDFKTQAVVNGKFETITLSQYQGKWLILFFYPLDFTFVCPTEILDFSSSADRFRDLGAEVVGVSVDSIYSHLAWISAPRSSGGLGGSLNVALAADLTRKMTTDYDALYLNSGHSLRATYIIDPLGIVRHISQNDPPAGRNVKEVVRILEALQFADSSGEVCPGGWTPGDPTIQPDPVGKLEFFKQRHQGHESCAGETE